MRIYWCCSVISIVRIESSSTYIAHVWSFIYIDDIETFINQFAIWYMVNPALNVNKVFRKKVDRFWRETLHQSKMFGKINVKNNNMCLILLVIFYDNIINNATKVYRVLSCVIYYFIESFFTLAISVVNKKQ